MSYHTNSFITLDKEVPSYEKNISICLGANGFSFSIVSTKNELLSIGEISIDETSSMAELIAFIKASLSEHDVPLFGFNRATLVVCSPYFVWVPNDLYEEGNDKKYLDPICKIPLGMGIYCEENELVNSRVVFAADNTVVSAFKIAIPGLKIRTQHSCFINNYMMDESQSATAILVNLRDGVSDIEVLKNRKLHLSNSFACANFDETMYHILNVVKQLAIEESGLKVLVCGNISREQFETMGKYVPSLDLYNGPNLIISSEKLHKHHRFHNPEIL